MLNGHFVIDATTHPYNLGPENTTEATSSWRRKKGLYMHHKMFSPKDEHYLVESEMFTDFDYDGFTEALFAESDVDYAFIHSLPNLGFNKKDIVEAHRAAALRDKYPGRYLMYGNVTPLDIGSALTRLQFQIDEYKIGGLKLYPAARHGLTLVPWRMDDRRVMYPIYEKLLENGITNVAIHKAVTLGSAPLEAFHVSDLEGAARDFPGIDFQIVHAGWAFLEETTLLMERYSNIYANLELTFSMLVNNPRMFALAVGKMLWFHLADQIVFSDGCNVVHPQPGLAKFAEFEMPRDLVEDMGYPELTDEIKGKILGGNIARIHGLDIEQLKSGIKGDEFELRKADGLEPPWAGIRKRLASAS